MKHVLIIGCGDIGQRVAGLCQQTGVTVFGLIHSENTEKQLKTLKISPIRGDLGQISSIKGVISQYREEIVGSNILYLAPPPSVGLTDPNMQNFLLALSEEQKLDNLPSKIILISTTAVYGDCHGEWITEEQPVNPQTERGKRRLDAENQLRAWSTITSVPIVILRVGGIYGDGRLPIDRIKKGLPILKEEDSPFTNRIHQDDLAQICVAALEKGKDREVYNVSDGQPSTMSYYFKAVAKANGLPQPPEVTKEEAEKVMTAGMLSYLKESRRLENHKILKGLGITLSYKTLDEGLIK